MTEVTLPKTFDLPFSHVYLVGRIAILAAALELSIRDIASALQVKGARTQAPTNIVRKLRDANTSADLPWSETTFAEVDEWSKEVERNLARRNSMIHCVYSNRASESGWHPVSIDGKAGETTSLPSIAQLDEVANALHLSRDAGDNLIFRLLPRLAPRVYWRFYADDDSNDPQIICRQEDGVWPLRPTSADIATLTEQFRDRYSEFFDIS